MNQRDTPVAPRGFEEANVAPAGNPPEAKVNRTLGNGRIAFEPAPVGGLPRQGRQVCAISANLDLRCAVDVHLDQTSGWSTRSSDRGTARCGICTSRINDQREQGCKRNYVHDVLPGLRPLRHNPQVVPDLRRYLERADIYAISVGFRIHHAFQRKPSVLDDDVDRRSLPRSIFF
jgi:hypothetical protein